jgi:competence protein ComEA
MKTWWAIAIAVAASLLGAGLLYLISSPPHGVPVILIPAPTPEPIHVYVTGCVKQPGVVRLPLNSRVEAALQAAGGSCENADLLPLNLAATLKDGDRVAVPTIRLTQVVPQASNSPTQAQPTVQVQYPLNLNTATLEELDTLPGIGPKTAQNILDYRFEKGSFQKIEELLDVPNIGPMTFEKIKDLVTVGN